MTGPFDVVEKYRHNRARGNYSKMELWKYPCEDPIYYPRLKVYGNCTLACKKIDSSLIWKSSSTAGFWKRNLTSECSMVRNFFLEIFFRSTSICLVNVVKYHFPILKEYSASIPQRRYFAHWFVTKYRISISTAREDPPLNFTGKVLTKSVAFNYKNKSLERTAEVNGIAF